MGNFLSHQEGPGLKIVGKSVWYGPGYCGICGDRGEDLIAQAIRFWCPDDGWKHGVLCRFCGEEASERGPKEGDYAYRKEDKSALIDASSMDGDEDATHSDFGAL